MRDLVDARKVRAFMEALGQRATSPCRVYLAGGSTAVLEGWRQTTVDVDVHLVPDSNAVLRHIPEIKEQLRINVEQACPGDFIPELPGWEGRSRYVGQAGPLSFFHYDFYAQVLAKIHRGLEKDLVDVNAMLERGLVERSRLWELFRRIEPVLYEKPQIDAAAFRHAVEVALGPEPDRARGGDR